MRIGLLDHMGYGNLGDAATQDALIAHIRQRVEHATFIGFSLNPEDTRRRHDIVCYSIKWWHPGLAPPAVPVVPGDAQPRKGRTPPRGLKNVLKAIPLVAVPVRAVRHAVNELRHIWTSFTILRSLDCLIISGGGQLGDLWRGPWSHPYNLFKFTWLARAARVPVLFINVGAGPLRHPLSRWFVKRAVQTGNYVSFRDTESRALVQTLGVAAESHVFPDSVYALDVQQPAVAPTSTRRVVGLNPIGFGDPRIWARHDADQYRDYLDKLTAFTMWLRSQGYAVRIFSAEQSVDLYAIQDLRARFTESLPIDVVDAMVGSPAADVRTLIAEMAGFDFVVTSKFHGVVFSHLLQKPVVAVSYHNKIDDLMRAADDSTRCLSIADFSVEELERAFVSAVREASALKAKYRQLTATRAALLASQFDDVFSTSRLGGGAADGRISALSEMPSMTSGRV